MINGFLALKARGFSTHDGRVLVQDRTVRLDCARACSQEQGRKGRTMGHRPQPSGVVFLWFSFKSPTVSTELTKNRFLSSPKELPKVELLIVF